jgi:hypothetical protein
LSCSPWKERDSYQHAWAAAQVAKDYHGPVAGIAASLVWEVLHVDWKQLLCDPIGWSKDTVNDLIDGVLGAMGGGPKEIAKSGARRR